MTEEITIYDERAIQALLKASTQINIWKEEIRSFWAIVRCSVNIEAIHRQSVGVILFRVELPNTNGRFLGVKRVVLGGRNNKDGLHLEVCYPGATKGIAISGNEEVPINLVKTVRAEFPSLFVATKQYFGEYFMPSTFLSWAMPPLF